MHDIIKEHVDRFAAELTIAIRQAIAQEVLDGVNKPVAKASTVAKKWKKSTKKTSMICIAPKCKQRSKGPRFHFLCEKHLDTPKRTYEKWREAAKG